MGSMLKYIEDYFTMNQDPWDMKNGEATFIEKKNKE